MYGENLISLNLSAVSSGGSRAMQIYKEGKKQIFFKCSKQLQSGSPKTADTANASVLLPLETV